MFCLRNTIMWLAKKELTFFTNRYTNLFNQLLGCAASLRALQEHAKIPQIDQIHLRNFKQDIKYLLEKAERFCK